MKKSNFIIIVLLFGYNILLAQKPVITKPQIGEKVLAVKTKANSGLLFDAKSNSYKKATDLISKPPNKRNTERRIVPGIKYAWQLPNGSNQTAGAWTRYAVNEKENYLKLKGDYYYPIRKTTDLPYPSYNSGNKTASVQVRPFEMNKVLEDWTKIGMNEIKGEGLEGKDGRINVFYFRKLKLGYLAFKNSQDYLLVVDTLHLTKASPFNNFILCIDPDKIPKIKILANTIIYESPISLSLTTNGEFIYSSSDILLKSPYADLKDFHLKGVPGLAFSATEGAEVKIFYNTPNKDDMILLNRLSVRIMEETLDTKLNLESDEWKKDNLIKQFQLYRFNRIKAEVLSNDAKTKVAMVKVVEKFDKKYGEHKLISKRSLGDLIVLSYGDINKLSSEDLKYYALPTMAKLQPIISSKGNLIGTIKYNTTGASKLKLIMECKLLHNQKIFESAQKTLTLKGLKLESNPPKRIITIDEQPLKMRGKTLGKIIPVSNEIVRLEIDLPEEAKTLLELFTLNALNTFKIDYLFNNELLTQEFTLDADKELLAKITKENVLESFETYSNQALLKEVKLLSNLDAQRPDEGALNYIETLLEFNFGSSTELKGPYRLSAYNTLAAERMVEFLKINTNYTLTVSGRAVYDNGTRDILPFTVEGDIISLDESIFQNQ